MLFRSGIYRKVVVDSVPNLVKEAYTGSPSRALFPLTEEFAESSNNSWVGMQGKGKLIQDIREYNGPYYECNGAVLSELCVPIFNKDNQIIGIIDIESHNANFFSTIHLIYISQICVELGKIALGNEGEK